MYRYYVSQAVLKGTDDGCIVRRISAGQIETAVIDQVRALLRQPNLRMSLVWDQRIMDEAAGILRGLSSVQMKDILTQLDKASRSASSSPEPHGEAARKNSRGPGRPDSTLVRFERTCPRIFLERPCLRPSQTP